jgi:Holliday junction resolvase RusA-like endonuclease
MAQLNNETYYKILIPGTPMAQPRPRFSRAKGFVRTYELKSSSDSKSHIQHTAINQINDYGQSLIPLTGPLAVRIVAKYPCPKSQHRKTKPPKARWKDNGPDIDNIAKHYMDALLASGMLAGDDRQVASLQVLKIQVAQGDSPSTLIEVTPLDVQKEEM